MKKVVSFLFVVIGLFNFITFSHASSAIVIEEDSKTQAKAVMGGVYDVFIKVAPYVYSDENSLEILKKDPVKKEELLKNLADLSTFFNSARHVEYFQRPGFKPSLESMNSHLSDTINSVNSNNFSFAQKRLSALTSLCISCHTQLSARGSQNAFGEAIKKSKRDDFESDYAFGNYLFLIRHFEDSEKYLKKAIDKALVESRSHELYSSIRRVISIHTKVEFNYQKANGFIDQYKNNPKLPILAKSTLKAWEKSLEEWKSFNPQKIESIEAFIKTYLSPLEEIKEQTGQGDNDITLLVASGILSKYLNDNPGGKLTPQILYWLAVAERRLSSTYFFTLSDLYLKDCVKLYSKSPFAKKCYGLYEENIQFGYTGSAGVDIPPEEKKELVNLRNYLK